MREPHFSTGERYYLAPQTEIRSNAPTKDGRKRFTFVISTGDQDRHGTVISPAGGDVKAFMRNPVVLYNHEYGQVIGRALGIEVKGGKMIAQMEFDEADPVASEVKRKVEDGFISAASIGFMVKEWTFDEENDQFKILQWELVEFSVVSVPSNRDALVMGRSAVVSELTQALQELRATVATLRRDISTPPISKIPEDKERDAASDAHSEPGAIAAAGDAKGSEESPEVGPETGPKPSSTADPVTEEKSLSDGLSPQEPATGDAKSPATAQDYAEILRHIMPLIRSTVRRQLGKE